MIIFPKPRCSDNKKFFHPISDYVAIEANENGRKGTSLPVIKDYLAGKYMVDLVSKAHVIKKCLISALEQGDLAKTSGLGISGSFKITAKGKKAGNKPKAMRKLEKQTKPKAVKKSMPAPKPEKTESKAPVKKASRKVPRSPQVKKAAVKKSAAKALVQEIAEKPSVQKIAAKPPGKQAKDVAEANSKGNKKAKAKAKSAKIDEKENAGAKKRAGKRVVEGAMTEQNRVDEEEPVVAKKPKQMTDPDSDDTDASDESNGEDVAPQLTVHKVPFKNVTTSRGANSKALIAYDSQPSDEETYSDISELDNEEERENAEILFDKLKSKPAAKEKKL